MLVECSTWGISEVSQLVEPAVAHSLGGCLLVVDRDRVPKFESRVTPVKSHEEVSQLTGET